MKTESDDNEGISQIENEENSNLGTHDPEGSNAQAGIIIDSAVNTEKISITPLFGGRTEGEGACSLLQINDIRILLDCGRGALYKDEEIIKARLAIIIILTYSNVCVFFSFK